MWEMLNNNTKKIVWLIIILIIPAFCFFGVSSFLVGRKNNPVVGTVNGRNVKLNEYTKHQDAVVLMARLIYRDEFARIRNNIDINKLTWDRLLMQKEVKEYGIKIEDNELARFITSIPYFVTNKKFDPAKYNFMLKKQLRISHTVFEKMLKEFMAMEKLKRIIADTVTVTEEEARIEYVAKNKKRRSYFVTVKIEDFKDIANIDNAMVEKFYSDAKENFQKPAQVKIKYVFQDWLSLQDSVEVTDEALKALYEENKDSYKQNGKQQTFEEVRKRIERHFKYTQAFVKAEEIISEVYNELEQGRTLKEAADKVGLLVQETGFINKGDTINTIGISAELTTNPFYMEDGKYTTPVKTAKGMALAVRVEGKDAYIPEISEIEDEIKEKIASEKASEIAKTEAEKQIADIRNLMNTQNLTFADACAKLEISYSETDYFGANDPVDQVFNFHIFRDKTFRLDFNEVSDLFLDKDAYVYLTPVSEKYPDLDDFNKQSKAIIDQYTRRRKHKMAQDWLIGLYAKYDLKDFTPALRKAAQEAASEK